MKRRDRRRGCQERREKDQDGLSDTNGQDQLNFYLDIAERTRLVLYRTHNFIFLRHQNNFKKKNRMWMRYPDE